MNEPASLPVLVDLTQESDDDDDAELARYGPPVISLLDSSDDDAEDQKPRARSREQRPRKRARRPQNQEIFADARRPQKLLEQELAHLQEQLAHVTDHSSIEWQIGQAQIQQLQTQLAATKHNAAQDIFHSHNARRDDWSVDFHGLYVAEAVSKFHEIILPVLPVQRQVAIITGRGRHSQNGTSALRAALQSCIEQTPEFRQGKMMHEVDRKNPGRLWVRWTVAPSPAK